LHAVTKRRGGVHASRHDTADGSQLQCIQTAKTPVTS